MSADPLPADRFSGRPGDATSSITARDNPLLARPLAADAWTFPAGVTYLNHGSFGPAPLPVREAQQEWTDRLQSNPMDFYVRKLEEYLDAARERLGKFVGCAPQHLLFVDNATVGMNLVARSLPLQAGDEILANDHEYGAVLRIWRSRCQETGAQVIVPRLPDRLESADDVLEPILNAVTPRTKLIIISQITSPTAIIFPVAKLCQKAKALGIPVCVDGPHAPAVVDLHLQSLGCDFYTASCHKWLSAPLGSGFLYVHPRWQSRLKPVITSWGASLSGRATHWHDDFNWSGTRDYSPYLAIPAAIDFLLQLADQPLAADRSRPATTGAKVHHDPAKGPTRLQLFRERGHALARYAREQLIPRTGCTPMIPDSPDWYGTMAACPLPDWILAPEGGHFHPLQKTLWERYGIEVPIVNWRDRRWIRVSCHLYNTVEQVDRLLTALDELFAELKR